VWDELRDEVAEPSDISDTSERTEGVRAGALRRARFGADSSELAEDTEADLLRAILEGPAPGVSDSSDPSRLEESRSP
jgi:hypothetical protein